MKTLVLLAVAAATASAMFVAENQGGEVPVMMTFDDSDATDSALGESIATMAHTLVAAQPAMLALNEEDPTDEAMVQNPLINPLIQPMPMVISENVLDQPELNVMPELAVMPVVSDMTRDLGKFSRDAIREVNRTLALPTPTFLTNLTSEQESGLLNVFNSIDIHNTTRKEVREKLGKWAKDNGMEEKLAEFEKNVTAKIAEVKKNMTDVIHQLDDAFAQVDTIMNNDTMTGEDKKTAIHETMDRFDPKVGQMLKLLGALSLPKKGGSMRPFHGLNGGKKTGEKKDKKKGGKNKKGNNNKNKKTDATDAADLSPSDPLPSTDDIFHPAVMPADYVEPVMSSGAMPESVVEEGTINAAVMPLDHVEPGTDTMDAAVMPALQPAVLADPVASRFASAAAAAKAQITPQMQKLV